MKRKLSLLLCALILSQASQLVACGNSEIGGSETTTANNSDTTTEAQETEISDDLPETDLEEYEFRILGFGDERFSAIWVDEQNGSIVNDAVYNKCRAVEDRFNCKITLAEGSTVGGAADTSTESRTIRQAVLSYEDSFDIVSAHDITMAGLSLEGLFMNLYEVEHLNFKQPWWPKYTVESMTLNDKMYLFSNSLSYNNMSDTRVFFFNKTMLDDLHIDYPYQQVYDGTWTLDSLNAITKQGYDDLNGNGTQDDDDQYGIVNFNYYYCFLEPFNLEPYVEKDGELVYEFDLDKNQTLVEKFYKILFSEGGHIIQKGARDAFCENRAIFIYDQLGSAVNTYSQSEVIYGILPMPKLDENQSVYYSGCTDRPLAVPITAAEHLDETGLIIEALSAEGYRRVFPAYFEQALKVRYADQTDDAKMIDIVNENVILSFTYMYGNYASPYNNMLATLFNINSPNTDVASYSASIKNAQEARCDTINEKFQSMN